jgi:acetylornithine deacetylase/succinyl-diaminopimelate desuccinylase-like protein
MNGMVNWKDATDNVVNNLIRLVQKQTVNPPGNELEAILVVKEILEQAGFPKDEIKIVESIPNRVNLVARLRGDGSKKPFLMSGHVDVVGVEREKWSHDPFGGEIIDGAVWGRGALDMKGFLAMYLQTFLELYRQKVPLKRDIILAAIADEENGFIHGSNMLVEQHPELIDAEYGITEGGALTIYFGKARAYPIQVAEKAICWIKARAIGKPGHGSIPQADNPVVMLSQAIVKLRQAKHLPVHLTPTFLKMIDSAGSQLSFPLGIVTRLLHSPTLMGFLLDRLKGDSSSILRAMATNTATPTMLHAGMKINVVPSQAEADLDCRLLPGQTPESVMKEIHRIVGNEIQLEMVYTSNGADFPTDNEFYRILERKTHKMDPGGIVIPMLMPGATDACQYKKAGIKMYGFTPGIFPPDVSLMAMAHGHNERMPISFIESGLPVLWETVMEFCGVGS